MSRRVARGALPVSAVAAFLLLVPSSEAATLFATPRGGPGYDEAGRQVAPTTLPFTDATLSLLQPGDTLQLLADAPKGTTRFGPRVAMKSKGSRASEKIVIRGLNARTRIVGRSIEALRNCAMPVEDVEKNCDRNAVVLAGLGIGRLLGESDLLDVLMDAAPRRPSAQARPDAFAYAIPAFGSSGRLKEAACLDLDRVDGLVIENVDFEDCWLSAVRAVASRRITLRRSLIRGGSYGLAVKGMPGSPANDITVEDVTWVQDTSGYARIARSGPQACVGAGGAAVPTDLGCPGQIWRRMPWAVTHHGVTEHHNGALLGGVDVEGKIVFRRNQVLSAYNGIRLKAGSCELIAASKLSPQTCPFNDDVWIGENLFSYVRDNPVELEVWSRNVRVARNRIHNSHAWFSLDNMGGGPVYIYGNRGWFDDMPALAWSDAALGGPACSRSPRAKPEAGGAFDPALDRRFDFRTATWLPVGLMRRAIDGGKPVDKWMDGAEQLCDRSIAGRVLKFDLPSKGASPDTFRYPSAPIYVFHNSWYLRAPLIGAGAAIHLRHWNNAILFCEPGTPGYHAELCAPRPAQLPRGGCDPTLVEGEKLARYPGERGQLPFFDCFRWLPVDEAGRDRPDLESEFDHDVSSNGFPLQLEANPKFERDGRRADPGFVAPAKGDFRLKPGAAAARSACRVQVAEGGGLECAHLAHTEASFTGAVSPSGELYKGPGGRLFAPPP